MTEPLTSYEWELLEDLASPGPSTLSWGALMSVCLESLQGRGYVTKSLTAIVTPAGLQALEERSQQS